MFGRGEHIADYAVEAIGRIRDDQRATIDAIRTLSEALTRIAARGDEREARRIAREAEENQRTAGIGARLDLLLSALAVLPGIHAEVVAIRQDLRLLQGTLDEIRGFQRTNGEVSAMVGAIEPKPHRHVWLRRTSEETAGVTRVIYGCRDCAAIETREA